MALSITVAPAGRGWTLKSDRLSLDLAFESGGRAEAYAREIASRLASAGQAVELEIVLRDGSLAATIPFAAAA